MRRTRAAAPVSAAGVGGAREKAGQSPKGPAGEWLTTQRSKLLLLTPRNGTRVKARLPEYP
ncbi:hypothetical protein SAMN04490357_6656 [Streptomyces misionensis]|uniref:Uncharacterized protein n=1 Tax=Streptomyces misionensis TaxID=67331 RepID=A0A1H5FGU3_9ACTN|nr:hypothetical protein SAMN04490357_6656 [Streptomyces misionensis]SFY49423.1 hypothetical protein STEPF1_02661 [Streptomyces sp. F-1]